jgi:hypothetical protein
MGGMPCRRANDPCHTLHQAVWPGRPPFFAGHLWSLHSLLCTRCARPAAPGGILLCAAPYLIHVYSWVVHSWAAPLTRPGLRSTHRSLLVVLPDDTAVGSQVTDQFRRARGWRRHLSRRRLVADACTVASCITRSMVLPLPCLGWWVRPGMRAAADAAHMVAPRLILHSV